MEMSSSNPVRGDRLPDWLQPFDENLVDEEEQRGDCVEVHEDMQDDDQERKGSCCTRRKSSTATSTQASQSGTRTDATSLTAAGVYIAYEEQEDPMRIADEQDKMKKKENNT